MAGQLTIDTLKASSGVLATQNGMTGIAKAWVNFNGTNGSIRSSFNVSSVSRTGVGTYTVSFTTSLPDSNYSVSGQASNATDTAANTSRSIGVPTFATGSFTMITTIGTAGANDFTFVTATVNGN